MREKIFKIIDESNKDSAISRIFDISITLLIVLNVISIILESFSSINEKYEAQLYAFEVFSVVIFTIEYLMRLTTADLKYDKKFGPALILFVLSPIALIDLFAILPFYIPFVIPIDLRFIRILRLLRITRIFKLNRYSRSIRLIGEVFKEKKAELGITVFITLIVLVIAATIMYYVEGGKQPHAFPNILATLWWAIATLTTVGYGDVYPITGIGKFLSAIIALLGIGLVALPTGILSAAFMDKMKKPDSGEHNKVTCPHCGHKIDRTNA